MFKSIKRVVLVATVLAFAILPSIASARVDGPDRSYSDAAAAVQAVTPAPAPAHQSLQASMSSFSWHDAGFGAAGMLVLIAVGTGATIAVRRRSVRPVIS